MSRALLDAKAFLVKVSQFKLCIVISADFKGLLAGLD
jgi:hypothetical protein